MTNFIIYMKTVNSKWPIELYCSNDNHSPWLHSLKEVKHCLKNNNKIFYRDINKHTSNKRLALYKSQITSITGPIHIPNSKQINIDDVMTLNEAVDRWKTITNVGTIRKAIFAKRFTPTEIRKSESIWLVTYGGMIRVFGPEDEYDHPRLVVQQAHFNQKKTYWEQVL